MSGNYQFRAMGLGMDYICNIIDEFNEAIRSYCHAEGDVFLCSDEVWEYVKERFDIRP